MADPTTGPGTDPVADPRTAGTVADRRVRDPLALIVGTVSLVVAVVAVLDPALVTAVDPRWVLAAAAVVVGLGALLATVRRR